MAFRDGDLYVAEVNRVIKFANIEANLDNPPTPEVIYDKLPSERHHGWKFIAFGPDDKLYVPVGAPCNICESEDKVFNSITRMDPDGSNFETLTRVQGAGTTNIAQRYQYLDENPMEASNYYRLKQVDYDGSYEYSEVKHIEFEAYQGEISLFPNPATNQLSIKLPEQLDGTVQIEIFDASGKRVYQDNRSADYLQSRIDVRAFGAGHYMMRIRSEQGGSSHRFTVLN